MDEEVVVPEKVILFDTVEVWVSSTYGVGRVRRIVGTCGNVGLEFFLFFIFKSKFLRWVLGSYDLKVDGSRG